MAEAGTVAVFLTGAFCTLPETQAPPIDFPRKRGVPMALATEFFVVGAQHGCTLFGMTPEEACRGATQHAARALGRTDAGTLAAGMRSDMVVWDIKFPAELAYRVGFYPLHFRIFRGFA